MDKYPGGGRLKRKEAQRKRQHRRAVKRRRKKGHSSVPSTAEGRRAAYYKKGGFLKNMARTPFGKGLLEAGSQMGGVMGMLSARKQAKQAASEAGLTGKDAKRAIRRQTLAGVLPGPLGAGLRKGLGAKDMANPTARGKDGVLVEEGGRVPTRKTKRLQRKAKRQMRKQQLKARGRYENGGKLTPMKKKKAGQDHRDGARMVGNYKKGSSNIRKEGRRVSDYEQHRQTSGKGKKGSARLAHELSGSTSSYQKPGGHNVGSLVKSKKRRRRR